LNTAKEIAAGLASELRRGTIVLSVLSRMTRPQYGYSLVQDLEGKGFPVDPGTLYPLLRRLESQGLLISEWETDGNKPRKYYTISNTGRAVYSLLCSEWKSMEESMKEMMETEDNNEQK
jgi:DNA-binding PadR family transcriptional regulator